MGVLSAFTKKNPICQHLACQAWHHYKLVAFVRIPKPAWKLLAAGMLIIL